jgi:hypothetical protein
MNPQLADLPTGVLVAIVIAGLLQVTLDVIALVDLYRRPVERVTLGNKWVWVAIILFVNLLGAILYLAVGRRPAPAAEVPQASRPTPERAEGVVESLYGRRDEGDDPR